MEKNNPFDRGLEAKTKTPTSVRTAATHTTDVLELAWLACQAVFRAQAKPEHALTLLPVFLARADAERQQLLADARAQMTDAPTPTAPARGRKKAE